MKGNVNGILVSKMVESQATRTKVANAVVCSKAVPNAKDAQLWKVAGDSVLELSDQEEINHAHVADNEY